MPAYSDIFIIYNPNSTGDSQAMARRLRDTLQKSLTDTDVQLLPTEYAGHAEKIAHDIALQEKAPLIISSSGDGGYNEVINGVIASKNKSAVCAVLPAGNANDHSRTMQDAPLAESILRGEVRRIDVLQVAVRAQGAQRTRYAHSYVGLGLTPVVAVELNRHTLNAFRESSIVLRTFFKYRPFKIKHDNKILRLDSLLFGNINQMAKVLTIAPQNKPDDGKFEVVAFPAGRKWNLVKRLAQAAVSKLNTAIRTDTYSFEVIKRMPMQLDGEVMELTAGSEVTVTARQQLLRSIF